ncbi:hypothetical protein T265_05488 [Opisthorchis viverrini]|uniref:Secreted protein n=1 Tax=Opisthorchis viverrini TaxID=6198 RepID=A0A074ZNS6_OPIVI|nr:hypothetical protein T265_05488 [Opisthorchis viverrini]KER27447.1 hypothetical protein T265_05488 [Opisthorchis viverrini]
MTAQFCSIFICGILGSIICGATPPWAHVFRNRSAVAPFRCLAAMPYEGSSTRAGVLSGCPSQDRGSREAEVGFEPRTFRSVKSLSSHLVHLAHGRNSYSVPSILIHSLFFTFVNKQWQHCDRDQFLRR